VKPPDPIADLQTIRSERSEIERWLKNSFYPLLKCRRKLTEDKCQATVKAIEGLLNEIDPIGEARNLKPCISIEPKWSGNWTAISTIPPEFDFSNASVSVDASSATQLGFAAPPDDLDLLQFLRRMSCDNDQSKVEFWIKNFFDSLRNAVSEKLDFQEAAAYFRHENGKIYSPMVTSYAKNESGTKCILRVIFAEAFVSPLTDSPRKVQLLSNGARVAVRTQLEVLDRFLGQTSQIYREKERKSSVGGRLQETLDAIWNEARSHGTRPDEPAPSLFDEGAAQASYENIRNRWIQICGELKRVAQQEDEAATGDYLKRNVCLPS
jgi:hypothetical protein